MTWGISLSLSHRECVGKSSKKIRAIHSFIEHRCTLLAASQQHGTTFTSIYNSRCRPIHIFQRRREDVPRCNGFTGSGGGGDGDRTAAPSLSLDSSRLSIRLLLKYLRYIIVTLVKTLHLFYLHHPGDSLSLLPHHHRVCRSVGSIMIVIIHSINQVIQPRRVRPILVLFVVVLT